MGLNYFLISLGALTAIVFLFLALVIGDMTYGFLIWLIIAIFIPKQIFLISIPGFPDIYLERLVFVIIAPLFLIRISGGREGRLSNTAVEYWMGILLFILFISMWRTGFLATPKGGFQPFHIFLTGFFFPFSFYYFAKHLVYTEERIRILLWGLFLLFAYLVVTAYLEHFKINGLIFPKFINDPLFGLHYGRARGPFGIAPVNGWVICSLFFTTLLLRLESDSIITRGILLLVLLATPLALFYTYTRAVWLAFLVAPVVVVMYSKNLLMQKRYVFFLIILVIIVGFVGKENIQSSDRAAGGVMEIAEVEARIQLYEVTKVIARDVPFFGVGFGRFVDSIPRYAPEVAAGGAEQMSSQHNIFFGMFSELGILGTVPFLIILIYLIKYSIALYRRLGEEGLISKNLVITFWAIGVTFLISASFIQTQYFIVANVLVFLWAGIIVGIYQRSLLLTEPEPLS
jgi:O-antigen ligase